MLLTCARAHSSIGVSVMKLWQTGIASKMRRVGPARGDPGGEEEPPACVDSVPISTPFTAEVGYLAACKTIFSRAVLSTTQLGAIVLEHDLIN